MVLENFPEDDDSLNLHNGRISNKAIENEEIGEVETSKQNGVDINLSSIWMELLQDDKDLNSKSTTSPPMLTMDASVAINHSDFHISEVQDEVFNTQDREFLSVLEDLTDLDDPLHPQSKNINAKVTSEGYCYFSGYFCSYTVFNLNYRVLTKKTDIKVLEKGLDYAPFFFFFFFF